MEKTDVDFGAAETDYQTGKFLSAVRRLRSFSRRSPTQEILFVECLAASGEFEEARTRALSLADASGMADLIRARAEGVLAEIYGENSELDKAEQLYQKARQTLLRINAFEYACETGIRHLAFLVNRCASAAVENLAAELEREAAKLGNRRLMCMYHCAAASYHGSALRLGLAKTHAALARAHLRAAPNSSLEATLGVVQSSICYLESDLSGAIEQAVCAAQWAEKSGHLWSRIASSGNAAFLYVRAGRPKDATKWLRESDALAINIPIFRINNLDTAAQLALLQNDQNAAGTIVTQLESTEAVRVLEKSWYALEVTYTRVRLHRILRNWAAVLSVAEQGLRLAEIRCNRDASARFSACAAEALAELQRDEEAVTQLVHAFGEIAHATLATHCELDRVMAVILARLGEHGLASQCMRRADTLANETGDAVLIAEAGRSAVPREADAVCTNDPARFILRLWHVVSSLRHPPVLCSVLSKEVLQDLAFCDSSNEKVSDTVSPAVRITPKPGRLQSLSASVLQAALTAVAAGSRTATPREAKSGATIAPERSKATEILIAPSMLRLLDTATRIAATPIIVLITGETGTGKEVLARFIHDASHRKAGRFMAVNCSALPRELLESQMFGHRRGAFTGAAESFEGIIKGAEGGTLFLDEVGDLPLDLQPKFLRFLETGEILPLGSTQPVKVNVRVIAATNANLADLVAQGRFRSDLYYRLNGIHFALPPLRSRREEIPAFATHLLDRFAAEFDKGSLSLTREALEHLLVYDWPGNLRQLASELRRAAALAEKNATVTPDLLSPEVVAIPPVEVPPPSTEPPISVPVDKGLAAAVQTIERTLIARALERSNGRLDDAARLLGISRKGLFLKRRRYRIDTTRDTKH